MRLFQLGLALVLGILLVSFGVQAEFDDDDNLEDGVVEDEPVPGPVTVEKQRYQAPSLQKKPFFAESFDSEEDFKKKWTSSQAKKDNIEEELAKYDGKWSLEEPKDSALIGDLGLVLKTKAKHHAVASKLDRPFEFKGKPFIVSYDVKFQNGIDCGGAYVKLLTKTDKFELKSFHDKTPYTVMFGPDKCGLDHKLHFIFRHKNPKTGEFEEKHAKKPSANLDKYFTDKKTHLYTLVVNPDNTFEVLIDNSVVNSGSLLQDVNPPVNPPKEIDDPNDKKPADWDENEKIADPNAKKPDDWDEDQPMEIPDTAAVKPAGWLDDEEALIPDPDAQRPKDWDEEMDGEWEAPLIDNPVCKDAPGCGEWTRPNIPNPLYKGKWRPAMIDNPNYQGEWKPQRIANPNYFEDLEPYKMSSIGALGLELWSMTDEIVFDNFIITDDREEHSVWVQQTWERKRAAEQATTGNGAFVQGILDVTHERPWLWAVFLVVIVLPIVLLIAYCCMSKEGPKQEDLDAARKKTDEASPDDDAKEEQENVTEPTDPGAAGDATGKTRGKKSKAALEQEEEEEEAEEEADVSQGSQEEEEEEVAQSKSDSPRRSPRKRRTRKD
ncbi:calnexin-like isoform X1 [Dreissena polymorpha]|uniref:calnexin-like isoform X1 n=1 Tax=Dreissena polymorpha TaxID=45954 RepID=UPI0022645D51|nr:calnexin-like isoform X1 [Dreissena polymorpha]